MSIAILISCLLLHGSRGFFLKSRLGTRFCLASLLLSPEPLASVHLNLKVEPKRDTLTDDADADAVNISGDTESSDDNVNVNDNDDDDDHNYDANSDRVEILQFVTRYVDGGGHVNI